MKNNIRFTLFLLNYIIFLFAQEIPNEFYLFESTKLMIDAGKNWSLNTSFNPIRYNFYNVDTVQSDKDKLHLNLRSGILTKDSDISLYCYLHARYKKYYYAYLYPRIVNNLTAFPRYSGLKRDISRLGFNSGETDLSGIGFENKWVILQYGRGRQSWGAGNDIQLTLNENSIAYDYGMLGLNFGNIKSRYIHGWLERADSINRYIVAKGIEWSNRENLIINISELVIYSGKNRTMDFGYLNPVSSHLEVELNNRQNVLGNSSANAIWQMSLDWMVKSKLRLSANFIIDELILDKIEKENGKENGLGYSAKLAWTPINDLRIMTIYFSLNYVGTHTLKHENGYNNFVQRGRPLGWIHGNDSQQIKTGFNYFQENNFILSSEAGMREVGEKSIIRSPYANNDEHNKGEFPSGEVENIKFFNIRLRKQIKRNISLIGEFQWNDSNTNGKHTSVDIGFDYYFNLKTKIFY